MKVGDTKRKRKIIEKKRERKSVCERKRESYLRLRKLRTNELGDARGQKGSSVKLRYAYILSVLGCEIKKYCYYHAQN